nr:Os06g0730950 [Ipomoea batatas]
MIKKQEAMTTKRIADIVLISTTPLDCVASMPQYSSEPSCNIDIQCLHNIASLAVHADQYDAHKMVATAISHRNTSATSTTGRLGEYSCTETEGKGNNCQAYINV